MSGAGRTPFKDYSRYYDVLYRDKDYAGEVDYIVRLLDRYEVSGRQILEFGSGTGRHGRLLAESGYRVHGIERSAEMVARAVQTDGFTCQVGDICSVRFENAYDAVLALFHVVSYQTENDQLAAVFKSAATHLQPGGLFIFDAWYSPAVYRQRPEVRVKRIEEGEFRVTRIAEPRVYPNENRVDVHYTIFSHVASENGWDVSTECHPMRHFSIPELRLVGEIAAFDWVRAEEFLTGREAGEDTWGICVVMRKQ